MAFPSFPARVLTYVLAAVLLLTGCSLPGTAQLPPTPTPLPPQPAIERPTYTVKRGDIIEALRLSGRVAAVKEDDLYFTKPGNIQKINVDVGDRVKRGQILAELEQSDLVRQLQQAQLTLEQAELALERGRAEQESQIELAELDLEEARLYLDAARTETERQLAEIGVRRAEIKLEQARNTTDQELEQQMAQARLEHRRVQAQVNAGRLIAPYDSEVAGVGPSPGDAVEPYQAIVTVMDPTEREVRIDNLTGAELERLSPNQRVQLTFYRYPDDPMTGTVERLPQQATSPDTEFQTDSAVHVSYDPGEFDLDIGDIVTVVVTLQHKEDVLWLPPQAIRTFQGRQFVVVEQDGRQRRVDVELGIRSGDKVEITEGLREGQVVIGQ